jgi:hypothetical protein
MQLHVRWSGTAQPMVQQLKTGTMHFAGKCEILMQSNIKISPFSAVSTFRLQSQRRKEAKNRKEKFHCSVQNEMNPL